MITGKFGLSLVLALIACLTPLPAEEWVNAWPFYTSSARASPDQPVEWQALGPFLFQGSTPGFNRVSGVRPIYGRFEETERDIREWHLLYPLFSSRIETDFIGWDLVKLVRYQKERRIGGGVSTGMDVFPILFHRSGPQPEDSYFGIFPLGGMVRHKFGQERISWVLFPLYWEAHRDAVETRGVLWPFFKFTGGEDGSGFSFWPFFGWREEEGRFQRRFALWPFVLHNLDHLDRDIPSETLALLPFYLRTETQAGRSETWVWPFFGYTRLHDPAYEEHRYLWPFFVQGRGDTRHVNRWAPVYTHSIRHGAEKTWLLWPLFRHEATVSRGLHQEKTQLLYFLFWQMRQTRPGEPDGPAAIKTHLWPLLSHWDNGAGREQIQFLSPLEVFFQHNEKVRTLYSPLFALYRMDRHGEEKVRHDWLFSLIRYRRAGQSTNFELGPLLRVNRSDESSGFRLLGGLLGRQKTEDGVAWQLFWSHQSEK